MEFTWLWRWHFTREPVDEYGVTLILSRYNRGIIVWSGVGHRFVGWTKYPVWRGVP